MSQFKVPYWHGRHPFPPDKKEPMVITRDKIVRFLLYGKTTYTDMNWLYASTDKIHVGIYSIPPRGRFDPPDIHEGDEVYYMLEGTLSILNPESGSVHEVLPGEGLLIPTRCWHQGHNFGKEPVTGIWAIAPLMWDLEKGPPTEYKPLDRKPIPEMTVINHSNVKRMILGKDHRIPVAIYTQTSMLSFGTFEVPLNEYSEAQVHQGDTVVLPLKGKLIVYLPMDDRTFEIRDDGEAFIIPQGVKHQYYNFTKDIVKAVFFVAPKL